MGGMDSRIEGLEDKDENEILWDGIGWEDGRMDRI
jgi:hypothetical protein